jgi:hypothetical protein
MTNMNDAGATVLNLPGSGFASRGNFAPARAGGRRFAKAIRARYWSVPHAMTRSHPASSPLRTLPAFVAWLVTLLQVVSALHFALVPHTFSAALGGVAHVHGEGRARAQPRGEGRAAALVSDAASCTVDSCSVANAPAGSVLPRAAMATGSVSFGDVSPLGAPSARVAASQRIFLSAPKTSPPV